MSSYVYRYPYFVLLVTHQLNKRTGFVAPEQVSHAQVLPKIYGFEVWQDLFVTWCHLQAGEWGSQGLQLKNEETFVQGRWNTESCSFFWSEERKSWWFTWWWWVRNPLFESFRCPPVIQSDSNSNAWCVTCFLVKPPDFTRKYTLLCPLTTRLRPRLSQVCSIATPNRCEKNKVGNLWTEETSNFHILKNTFRHLFGITMKSYEIP